MTRALFWISLLACTAVGAFHTVIGLSSFEPLSPSLVWFLAAGLAILLNALVNFFGWRASPSDRVVRRFMHTSNVIMTGLGVLAVRAVDEPQQYIALASFLGLLAAGLANDRVPAERGALAPRVDSDTPAV